MVSKGSMVVCMVALLVFSVLVEEAMSRDIGYGAVGQNGQPGGPPGKANNYQRGCEPTEGCKSDHDHNN